MPIVSIAGAVSIGTCAFIWYLYFHYAAFGLVKHGTFFTMIAVVIGAAILLYFGSAAIRKRQGVDLRLAYAEIPPE